MMIEYVEEESILLPIDTRFSIEAFLDETDDLLEPRKDGTYQMTFYPATFQDHQRLQEVAAHAKSKVELCRPMWSRKTPELAYETRTGSIYTSQLNPAKLNIPMQPWDAPLLRGKQASLNLRFQDTKLGKIYLICDWVDCYTDPTEPVQQEGACAGSDDPDNDW